MSETVIQVENLSKQYQLGTIGSGTLYRDIQSWWARLRGKEDPNVPVGQWAQNQIENGHRFWALRDVSFEIKQGEIVGIIGRNGAGKSTLLKILSRVTGPTSGQVKMKGRVTSLLEVGTGFHPELTGRENVYLNGTILGMRKHEIDRKFEEIVDFAEISKFIDTPVKRYSSGMYVRLAFAVAAHFEPEILIVDEVLAVGDIQFQKKCLGKMGDACKEGRTVLFVSHNMEAISSLCTTGIILQSGSLAYQGAIREVIASYNDISNRELSVDNCSRRGGSGGIKLEKVWITDDLQSNITQLVAEQSCFINIDAAVSSEYQDGKVITVGIGIDTIEGTRLFTCLSSSIEHSIKTCGEYLNVKCKLPFLPLIPGNYLVSVAIIYYGETLDMSEHCDMFEIIPKPETELFEYRDPKHGNLFLPFYFEQITK